MLGTSPKPRNLIASMSTERAPGIESTGPTNDELADQLSRVQDRLDAVEAENERLHAELDATRKQQREDLHVLVRENHELRRSQKQLEARVEEIEDERDQLQRELERAEASRGHIIEDIVDVEEQLDDVEAGSGSAMGGDDTAEPTQQ